MDELFMYDPLTTGTKGLLFIGEKIVIYRRDTKTELFPLLLDLPGGGLEGKEAPFETFKREVKEEFDLDITPEDIVYTRNYPSSLTKGRTARFVVAKLPQKAEQLIHFGDEGIEYFLMTPDEYLNRTDAWVVMQERTADYLRSQHTQSS